MGLLRPHGFLDWTWAGGAAYANGALVIECLYLQLPRHNFPHSLGLGVQRMYM